MQILECSGEELDDVASECFMPVIAHTRPDFRGRIALQEPGATLTLSRRHWGQMSRLRTDRMVAKASADDVMVFCVQPAGRGRVRQKTASPSIRSVRECCARRVAAPSGSHRPRPGVRPCPEEVLLDVMRIYVREHLADPRLRVEELARRHHVSVCQAYGLFERIGATPGAYLVRHGCRRAGRCCPTGGTTG